MKAICYPQPLAGLVLSGQVDTINAGRYTAHRGELLIYATPPLDDLQSLMHNINAKHVPGLMDVDRAFLGMVEVTGASDSYECDAPAYVGGAWHWHTHVADMLTQPLDGRVSRRPPATLFDVPADVLDQLDALRVGWSRWWDDRLDEIRRLRLQAKTDTLKGGLVD